MSAIEIFAFIVLPAVVAAGGWLIVLADERRIRRKHRTHPAE